MHFGNSELKRRIAAAQQLQRGPGKTSRWLHDPIEDEEPTGSLIRRVRDRADAEVDPETGFGRCHAVWGRTKEILKQEYGIEWYSPAEMNPDIIFD